MKISLERVKEVLMAPGAIYALWDLTGEKAGMCARGKALRLAGIDNYMSQKLPDGHVSGLGRIVTRNNQGLKGVDRFGHPNYEFGIDHELWSEHMQATIQAFDLYEQYGILEFEPEARAYLDALKQPVKVEEEVLV